ncbi:MAG: hypothetical protein CMD42_05215 [Gammaproteobacteria bacterium]|nr:hypothetical protein [Gammaproteobacteria bacterium]
MQKKHKVSQISSEAIFAIPSMKARKVIVSMLLCIGFIFMDLNFNTSYSIRGYVKDVIQPLSYLREIPANLLDYYNDFFSSKKELLIEIKELKDENQKITLVNSLLNEVAKENQALKSVWELVQHDQEIYTLAKKRYISSDYLRPILTLDISDSGKSILPNFPVLTKSGLVGLIRSVGLNNAEVMLVHDLRSKIPVISSESRLHGIVQGNGIGKLGKLTNIKKTAHFVEGEVLSSSGLGEVFPAGFFVAQIISIVDEPDNEFLDIRVSFLDIPENEDYFLIFTDKG